MNLDKRRTIQITQDAIDNMQIVSKSLGVTQFELISILLEDASADNDSLIKRANAVTKSKLASREANKALRKKLSAADPEKLKAALALIEDAD